MTGPAPSPEVRVLWSGLLHGLDVRVLDRDGLGTWVQYLDGDSWESATERDLIWHALYNASQVRLAAAEARCDLLKASGDALVTGVDQLGERLAAAEARAVSLRNELDGLQRYMKSASWQNEEAAVKRAKDADERLAKLADAAHSLMQGPTATNICTPEGKPLYPEMIGVSLEKMDGLRAAVDEAKGK